jgi:hypothetical protein
MDATGDTWCMQVYCGVYSTVHITDALQDRSLQLPLSLDLFPAGWVTGRGQAR